MSVEKCCARLTLKLTLIYERMNFWDEIPNESENSGISDRNFCVFRSYLTKNFSHPTNRINHRFLRVNQLSRRIYHFYSNLLHTILVQSSCRRKKSNTKKKNNYNVTFTAIFPSYKECSESNPSRRAERSLRVNIILSCTSSTRSVMKSHGDCVTSREER